MKKKRVVNIKFAKSADYRKVISEIAEKGKCPFCPGNFKYHKHPILLNCGSWFVTKISWPYKNTKSHFIIIGRKHKEKISELSVDDVKDILYLINFISEKYKMNGGAFAMRFGDTNYTGATVCHLHVHLISPQKGKTVNFPIG